MTNEIFRVWMIRGLRVTMPLMYILFALSPLSLAQEELDGRDIRVGRGEALF